MRGSELLETLDSLSQSRRWRAILSLTRGANVEALFPDIRGQVLYFEALALFHDERPREARSSARAALSDAPDNPGLCDLAARIDAKLGRHDDAISMHLRALTAVGGSLELRQKVGHNYVLTLMQRERYAEALGVIADLPSHTGPWASRLRLAKAQCLLAVGDHAEAVRTFSSVSSDSDCANIARFGIANALAAQGELKRAVRAYSALLGRGSEVEIRYNCANALLNSAQVRAALRVCRSAWRRGLRAPELRCLHAQCIARMGAKEAAVQILDEALPRLRRRSGRKALLDEFVALRAELLLGLHRGNEAREGLLAMLRRSAQTLPRSFAVLNASRALPSNKAREWKVVATSVKAGWRDTFEVVAVSADEAHRLVQELYHEPEPELCVTPQHALAEALEQTTRAPLLMTRRREALIENI